MEDGTNDLSIFDPPSSIFAFGDSSRIAIITAPISAAVSKSPIISSGKTNLVISASPICLTVTSTYSAGSRWLAKLWITHQESVTNTEIVISKPQNHEVENTDF